MGFVLTEFAKIPPVPARYQHQSERLTLISYLVPEGASVEPGTALALLENWWARFELMCEVKAIAAKNLLDGVPGISLNEGSPVSFLFIDPDDLGPDQKICTLRHVADIRTKPKARRAPPNKSPERTREE